MPMFRIGSPLPCSFPIGSKPNVLRTLDDEHLLRSLVYSIVPTTCVAGAWYLGIPGSLPLAEPSLLAMLAFLLVVIAGHEWLHLLGFPRAGLGAGSTAGFWPAKACPYVQHLEPMRRNRFILACLLPFLGLTLLPFAMAANGLMAPGFLSWVSVANTIGAASDLYIVAKVLALIPAHAWVLESGESLLWGGIEEPEGLPAE